MDVQDAELREQALTQLRKKRDFRAHVMAYVLVNAMLVVIWAVTSNGGFFWPMFSILGWGIGVFFNAWDVYTAPPTETQIRREMERLAKG
jgi:hypothetical protein